MTSYKIVSLNNMNECLHKDISVTEVNLYVNVNNSSEKVLPTKNPASSD
jgi:hypothetical protein